MRVSDFSTVDDHHNWELILSILEDFESAKSNNPHVTLKDRAIEYIDLDTDRKLNRSELRSLIAKANKLKTSSKKEERARGHDLAKRIQSAFNSP
jgi:hypothetical protein